MVGAIQVIVAKYDSIKLEVCNIIHEVVKMKNMKTEFIFYPRTTSHCMSFFLLQYMCVGVCARACLYYIKEKSLKRAQEKLFVTMTNFLD
jgi:NADH:ubiquinone oxidoreductase subunit E